MEKEDALSYIAAYAKVFSQPTYQPSTIIIFCVTIKHKNSYREKEAHFWWFNDFFVQYIFFSCFDYGKMHS